MLDTAANHFSEDIERAKQILNHADGQAACTLRDDLIRASWMMAVGACDAYFSDAYVDLVSRTLRAKEIEPLIEIPNKLNNLKIPAIAVIRQESDGWRWRMAARELIEEENVLSLEKIRSLFNHFLPNGKKLINKDSIGEWIIHRDSRQRLFGIAATQYRTKIRNRREFHAKRLLRNFISGIRLFSKEGTIVFTIAIGQKAHLNPSTLFRQIRQYKTSSFSYLDAMRC